MRIQDVRILFEKADCNGDGLIVRTPTPYACILRSLLLPASCKLRTTRSLLPGSSSDCHTHANGPGGQSDKSLYRTVDAGSAKTVNKNLGCC